MKVRFLAVAVTAVLAAPAVAQSFDPAPWVADLEQARQAFHEKYANLEWLENERGLKIDPLFDRKEGVLRLNAIYAEPGATPSDWPPAERAIGELAAWLGADEVVWPALPVVWR